MAGDKITLADVTLAAALEPSEMVQLDFKFIPRYQQMARRIDGARVFINVSSAVCCGDGWRLKMAGALLKKAPIGIALYSVFALLLPRRLHKLRPRPRMSRAYGSSCAPQAPKHLFRSAA